ncbi:hypothetical protein MBLNU457_5698t2 [Dothideomycetes sp. NU457]
MPGSSLWLLPPPNTPLNTHLQTLITSTLPSRFPSTKAHNFIPHITLTSNVPASLHSPDPQAWLDSLDLPASSTITAEVVAVDPDDKFFKKLTLRLEKKGVLVDLATACRAQGVLDGDGAGAEKWAEEDAELPKADVAKKLDVVKRDLQDMRGQLNAQAEDKVAHGGVVVLVPTDKPIHEWDPIARRELSHVDWVWKEDLFAE